MRCRSKPLTSFSSKRSQPLPQIDFDHVPACRAESRFQFLDHFTVATHRAVQSLQVAIDHEYQIIQAFAAAERDRSQRFRLIHLAIAKESPDLASLRLL